MTVARYERATCGAGICVQQGLLRLGHVGEQLVGACEAQMEVCKMRLLDTGVCDESSVYQVHCLVPPWGLIHVLSVCEHRS